MRTPSKTQKATSSGRDFTDSHDASDNSPWDSLKESMSSSVAAAASVLMTLRIQAGNFQQLCKRNNRWVIATAVSIYIGFILWQELKTTFSFVESYGTLDHSFPVLAAYEKNVNNDVNNSMLILLAGMESPLQSSLTKNASVAMTWANDHATKMENTTTGTAASTSNLQEEVMNKTFRNPTHTTKDEEKTRKIVHQGRFNKLSQEDLDDFLSDEQSLIIFYNIYIPNTLEGQNNTFRIVQEQIQQVNRSYALEAFTSTKSSDPPEEDQPLELFFVTLGTNNVLTENIMQEQFCGDPKILKCIHLEHRDLGWEVLTLGYMFDHCVKEEEVKLQKRKSISSTSRVVYIHNKGSLHQWKHTENWRYSLTAAPLSEHCLGLQSRQSTCNACGLTFYTTWTMFFTGNMFTAKCDYVSKLIPPHNFSARMEDAMETILPMRLRQQLVTDIQVDSIDVFGLARFSDEHWIGSQPDLQACDTNTQGNIFSYKRRRVEPKHMKWRLAPTITGTPTKNLDNKFKLLPGLPDWRKREYHLLPGNLMKWFLLYGKAPPETSWAWKWFPDGEFWQQAIKEFGADAVDKITQKYKSPLLIPADPEETIFAPNEKDDIGTNAKALFRAEGDEMSAHVFFHIEAPFNSTPEILQSVYNLVYKQASVIDSSFSRSLTPTAKEGNSTLTTKLYFVTSGHENLAGFNPCTGVEKGRNVSSNIACHRLAHYQHNHPGETIRRLYGFCQRFPTRRVVYVQNKVSAALSGLDSLQQNNVILQATRAVTHSVCLNALHRNNENSSSPSCNLCGLVFHTLPALMMDPGLWAAECSYINRLIPPEAFPNRMEKFISRAIIERLKKRITFSILKEQPDSLGLDMYAMDHWVGSHPSILPCDTSPASEDILFWASKADNTSNFKLTFGGHHVLGAPNIYNSARGERMRTRKRLHEFYFLAGNIMKWQILYGEVPNASSWVWKYFPDGNEWLLNVQKYGNQVIQTVNNRAF